MEIPRSPDAVARNSPTGALRTSFAKIRRHQTRYGWPISENVLYHISPVETPRGIQEIRNVASGCGSICKRGRSRYRLSMQRDPFPPLETTRLTLRCVSLEDAAATAMMMTPEVSRWVASWPVPFTQQMALERIRTSREAALAGDALPFAIIEKASGELVGWFVIQRGITNRQHGDVGYWFGEKHHGKGYMRELAPVALAAGFELLDLEAIDATVQPGNAASIAVILSCGMRPIGERMYYASARQRNELCLVYQIKRPIPRRAISYS
jgi:ribosomal-protein-alanine N-acetyltransferase